MRYNLLGRTGLKISAISLGTVELGLDYGLPGHDQRPTAKEAERLIHHALASGINHLDTARAYGDSEAIIGQALAGRRLDVLLTTKVSGGNLPAMTASIETSLGHLQTDYVDILMLHTPLDEQAAEHLLILQARGYCHYLGASVYGPTAALAAIETGIFDCLQIAYSPLDRRPELQVLARAAETQTGLIARSVLLKGTLTHRYRTLPATYSDLQNAIAQLETLGLPLPELAYRYVAGQTTTALAGTAHIAELDEILTYSEPLPEALRQQIRQQPGLPEHWLNPGLWPSG